MRTVRLDFVGELKGIRETPQGGIRVDARIARVGVQTYQRGDGSVFREFRPADEVFHVDALTSFEHAPVTVGHPEEVRAENWRKHTVGHLAGAPKQDGDFVAAELIVQDAETIRAIRARELVEVSCGYTCELDETRGDGFDGIQRSIRGNHVALGPRGWGRAGPDVALRVDGLYQVPKPYSAFMTLEEMQAELEKSKAKRKDAEKRADAAEGQVAALTEQLAKSEKARADAADPKRIDEAVRARVALEESARNLVEGGDFSGKSDTDVMTLAIQAADPTFRADGKSVDFVRGCFEAHCARPHPTLARARVDANEAAPANDAIETARLRNEERNRKRHDAARKGN